MHRMKKLHCCFFLLLSCFSIFSQSSQQISGASNGSSPCQGDLQYHMGPVLVGQINIHLIWYGKWYSNQQAIIRDFLHSLSSPFPPSPSVADWWKTVQLYTDQSGSNVSKSITLVAEFNDFHYSHGVRLQRLDMHSIIRAAVGHGALPLDPMNGLYLVLTSSDVSVQDFCTPICGFHYFTFPTTVGAIVPFAWVGNSDTQCPGVCAYPFVRPQGSGPLPPPGKAGGYSSTMGAPNGDIGVDGMISVIAHELAEVSTDPLMNGWYAGKDSMAPVEIADMCEGVYGRGGGGGYVGDVQIDGEGRGYNLNGVTERRFLVQWVYNTYKCQCDGPNYAHN